MRSANKSLRALLLWRMLSVLLPTLIVGSVLSYFLAARGVVHAFDLGLLDDATDLARELLIEQDKIELNLPPDARQMLLSNNEDNERYAVWDSRGRLISGDMAVLQHFLPNAPASYEFRVVELEGNNYRGVLLRDTSLREPIFIGVVQTTHGLDRILRDIFGSVVFLGASISLMALIGVAIGIRRGLQPVEQLRAEILSRSPTALHPLNAFEAPLELQPIVHSINELLVSLDESLQRHRHFIASAAHQLRTPLAVLSTQLELSLKEQPREFHAVLQRLLATVRRASHLSSQLLSLARLESANEGEMPMQSVALADVIRAAVANYVVLAERKKIELNFEIDAARIQGQTILLEEMIGNLLENAINYAGDGAKICIRSISGVGNVVLTIADDGPGVSPQTLAALGNPFFRGEAADTKGSGLGLVIVKEIVRLHRGSLQFKAGKNNRGLVVEIHLPLMH